MKYLLTCCLFTLLLSFCKGQNFPLCYTDSFSLSSDENENIFIEPTIDASFKGGFRRWHEFLSAIASWSNIIKFIPDTLNYFEDSVIMRFVVGRKGGLSNLEVSYSGFEALEKEAVRLIKISCPKWNPGYSSGGGPINSWRKVKLYFLWDNRNDKLVTRIGEIYR